MREEAKAEHRFQGLERKVSALVDGAARAEHRERELNKRIADLAEGWLKGAGEAACEEAAIQPRLGDLEHLFREVNNRVGGLEHSCQNFGQRLVAVEELSRELGTLLQAERRRGARDDFDARLSALEQRLDSALQDAQVPLLAHVKILEGKLERHCLEFDSMAEQLMSQCRKLEDLQTAQSAKQQSEARALAERHRCLSTRLEDAGHTIVALKVRADGLESRLAKASDRIEATCRPLEAHVKSELEQQRRWLSGEMEARLDLIEQRLEALRQDCEEAMEDSAQLAPSNRVAQRHREVDCIQDIPARSSTPRKLVEERKSRVERIRKDRPSRSSTLWE